MVVTNFLVENKGRETEGKKEEKQQIILSDVDTEYVIFTDERYMHILAWYMNTQYFIEYIGKFIQCCGRKVE